MRAPVWLRRYYDAMGQEQYEHPREIQTYPKPEVKTKPVWFDAMHKADAQLHNILSQMYVARDKARSNAYLR